MSTEFNISATLEIENFEAYKLQLEKIKDHFLEIKQLIDTMPHINIKLITSKNGEKV